MENLEQARETINEIDAQMATLFAARMDAVAQVAAYKATHGLPILDEQREQQVLARNAALVSEDIRPYYEQFLAETMAVSRAYQQHLMEGESDEQ